MSVRKPFNDKVGYIASLRSGAGRGWVVIYEAEAQGIDPAGGRYAIVCETHSTIAKATSLPTARGIMKAVDFCEACMAARTELVKGAFQGRGV